MSLDGGWKGAGLISTTDGIGTQVSDNDFADINPSYAGEFKSFSKAKPFRPRASPSHEPTRVSRSTTSVSSARRDSRLDSAPSGSKTAVPSRMVWSSPAWHRARHWRTC
jgi:hypothetical protein